MNIIKNKPYLLFLIFGLITISIGFLIEDNEFDINIHDTYILMSRRNLIIILSIPYILFSLIYLGLLKLRFKLINWITVFHVLCGFIGLFLVLAVVHFTRLRLPRRYNILWDDIEFNEKITYGSYILILIIFIAQFLFLTNIIYALAKGKK